MAGVSVQPGTAAPPEPVHPRHVADDPRAVLARPLAATSLLDAVKDLRRDVEATSFPLDLPGTDSARASRARLVDQLGEHLIPRLTQLSAPAVVVVAGSTGAGKSTLVNSLVGAEVSAAGVLRPTTRRPVLVHHPLDAELVAHLPMLDAVDVVTSDLVPRGVAMLDAPDLDSVLESNRDQAHRLLEAADLWLFVTTAARYGDALPWRVLEAAVQRGASIAMVLNRVPPASLPTVRGDLLDRLRAHGMDGSPLFVVPDLGPHEGLLDAAVVAPVQRWLTNLAGPDRSRTVIARTLRGAFAALRPWVDELAEAVQDQVDAAAGIAAALDDAVVAPVDAAQSSLRGGAVADGAVRARWAGLTAPGAPLAGLVKGSGRVAGSARDATARAAAVEPLVDELRRAAAAAFAAAGGHAEEALADVLEGTGAPVGAASVRGAWDRRAVRDDRGRSAERAAREWTAQGVRAVRLSLTTAADDGDRSRDAQRAAKRRRQVEKAVGVDTLGGIALAAAAGVDEAATLLRTLVGDDVADRAVASLRDDLLGHVPALVAQERAAAAAPLAQEDLADDAASRLRLRLAVLKGLT
ncbi:dynamin family protein [Cellulomonas alba]|uniref:Dynamin family protein n=1 Tax=Cellulomonas alba TaxID=3053467 RepID=A0ABT7SK96_9CELL|nr:dynamin family protein [Cellulomonas alba]MDM7855944.1 dynamin family protein [Cellulomonas alba]